MATAEHKPRRQRRPLVHRGVELRCDWTYERQAQDEGRVAVAGIDEVGRGALCGPVIACAVVLGDGFDADGIDDSKRLTARQRERLSQRVREKARAYALGIVEPAEIDRINVLRATYLAMTRALENLGITPDLLLVDALTVPGLSVAQKAIIKGDAVSVSIAAASIVAKVERDGIMQEWDRRCPGYGFARNMGYASQSHRDALKTLGPTEIHRRTFYGVRQMPLF